MACAFTNTSGEFYILLERLEMIQKEFSMKISS